MFFIAQKHKSYFLTFCQMLSWIVKFDNMSSSRIYMACIKISFLGDRHFYLEKIWLVKVCW